MKRYFSKEDTQMADIAKYLMYTFTMDGHLYCS